MPFCTESAGTWPGQRSSAGTRKPPSSTVPLDCANGVCPPSGQVKTSVPLSVVKSDDGVVVLAHVLELLHDEADIVVELRHAGFFFRPAVLRVAQRLVFRREMRHDVHARRVEPDEERLAVLLGLVHEIDGKVANLVVHGLHALGIERAGVLDLLLADLAPARLLGRIVDVGRPAVDHVARADDVQQVLRIVGMRRVFHRVEVVKVAEEFVEAVHRRQELVLVAEMVLAELAGGVAHGLQHGGDGHRFGGQADLGAPAWPTVVMPVRMGSSPVMKLARPAVQLASA